MLGSLGHVCAFFQNREDEYRVLLPFIKEGFEQRDRPFHIVDPTRLDDQDDPFFVPSDELLSELRSRESHPQSNPRP